VLGALLRTAICLLAVVLTALLVGFRAAAGPGAWLAVFGLLMLLALALTWVGVVAGLMARNAGSANSIGLPMQLLPFVSSAFVPTGTMSPGVRWFAGHQPFTPIIDTVRALLAGTPVGGQGWLAVAWCLVVAAAAYAGALAAYAREPRR